MKNSSHFPPVIIIGMHRSGTSMITRLLESMGLLVGKKKDANSESIFFLRINEWLLTQSGGSWDHPEPIHQLLNNTRIRCSIVRYLRLMLGSWRAYSFMGLRKYLRYRSLEKVDVPWGWKDPRNTFTLPLWLDIFPQAKVIHIYRHGVDVANSLRIRQEISADALEKSLSNRKLKFFLNFFLRPLRQHFLRAVRCCSLNEGFLLWEQYEQEARTSVGRLGNRALQIKYEDFLCNPYEHLESLASFCGLKVKRDKFKKLSSRIDKTRAYAYKRSGELRAFAYSSADILKGQGY